MIHKVLAALALALVATQSAAADAPARRTLNFDDFFRVQDLSDPQVSPDGLWVAYVVSSNDRAADEERSAIWMVSWDGKEHLQLTNAAADTEKPRWSPDGRYLSYLGKAPATDNAQIMLLDRRGGEPRQLTNVNSDIKNYAWSPDGKRLVIAMQPADEAKVPKPIVIDAWHFKQDEDGYLAAGHVRHLYLLDVESKRLDALTADAQFNEDLPAWSPDGRQIAFVRTREMPVDSDGRAEIDVVEANPGAVPKNLARPYAPNNQRLAFSPDGKLLAYLQGLEPKDNAYMQDHLVVMPATGGASRALADKLDRQVMSYAFSADSTAITIAVEDDTSVYPARVDLANGSVAREINGPFTVSKLSMGGGHTALLQSSDNALAEIYALENGKLRKLTAHNDALLSEIMLGAVEDVRFQSSGGAEIHGLIVKPPSFVAGRRYPTLLWIHGGPNGQDEHSLNIDGYEYEPQMFAARGFVVLRVNYRGSSGRGIEFAKRIFADWGHLEVEDLLAGVDHVVSMGVADKDRLAIGGWSYGGLLTDYTIASDRRFKVAVSGAGSGNQLSTYGSDEYVLQYNNELGVPWNNAALWLKVSYPFFHADRIHTPTLFLGGDKDFNVPIIGGEQMYQALRTLGVPAQLVVYPGQHHIFTRPSFLKDLAERTSVWLDRFIPH